MTQNVSAASSCHGRQQRTLAQSGWPLHNRPAHFFGRSSVWVPRSAMVSCEMTTTSGADWTIDRRQAIIKSVLPEATLSRASCTLASDSAFSKLVGLQKHHIVAELHVLLSHIHILLLQTHSAYRLVPAQPYTTLSRALAPWSQTLHDDGLQENS